MPGLPARHLPLCPNHRGLVPVLGTKMPGGLLPESDCGPDCQDSPDEQEDPPQRLEIEGQRPPRSEVVWRRLPCHNNQEDPDEGGEKSRDPYPGEPRSCSRMTAAHSFPAAVGLGGRG